MKNYLYYLVLMVGLVTTSAYAKEPTVYGKTYGEWSAEWMKWAYAGPIDNNPIEDLTGASCDFKQDNPHVWFLAGSFGKTGVVRDCTIPKGRALFYPLIEGGWIDCPNSEDSSVTEDVIRQIIAGIRDNTSLLTSTLDGVAVSSLSPQILTVRTQSPVFSVDLPVDNIFVTSVTGCADDLPAGPTGRNIIDGYWVMLPSLSPGHHVLKLHGSSLPDFDNEVTYNLTVLEGK